MVLSQNLIGALLGSACLIAAQGCTLDRRVLVRSTDGGALTEADSAVQGSTSGVHLLDSSTIDYSRPEVGGGDTGASAPIDAGPCVHLDEFGNPDCSETLLRNADFNRNLDGWEAVAGAKVRWVDFDVQNAKTSGAIGVKNAEQGDFDGTVGVAAEQCLPAIPGAAYNYVTSMYIAHDQAFGFGQLLVFFYDGTDCTGLVDSAYAVTQIESTEQWLRGGGQLKVPAQVRSMGVRLHVEKPFRSDVLEVLFDAVRVTQSTQ